VFPVVALSAALLIVPAARAEIIYGIADSWNAQPQTLVRFDSATPGSVTTVGVLDGLAPGQFAAAIDFRPSTRQLYVGAAMRGFEPGAQLFTVDLNTAALTPVGPPFDPTGYGYPSFDFDPVRDQLRTVTTTIGVADPTPNARFDPKTAALIANDANLAFGAGDPNAGNNPPQLVGAAYTNSIAGAGSTTLYAYDVNTDNLVRIGGVGGIPSPDAGELFTIGASGFVVNSLNFGFDISGATGVAYISSFVEGSPDAQLFTVDLATGAMRNVGAILAPDGAPVMDISVVVPEPLFLPVAAGVASYALLHRGQRRRYPCRV